MPLPEQKIVNIVYCQPCAERGRPNEPVYKIGMCFFCYSGKRHPRATKEQLVREETGGSSGVSQDK